ncbi:MAG: hypothetical protein E7671_00340 [Ruminococcaceae bacterium]|nr:hypothetical protein [Oscillospiraceae bacterium]
MVVEKQSNTSGNGAALFAVGFALFCVLLALATALLVFVSVSAFESIDKKAFPSGIVIRGEVPPSYPTVIIDAGHGGEDGGAVGINGAKEKDLNLDISFKLCDMLKNAGFNVIMTRTEDILLYDRNADYKGRKKSLDLRARLEKAKSVADPIFISIHMNAFPSSKYSGLQVWYSKNDNGSRILADIIQERVKSTLQNENNRKTKAADSSIYLLDRAEYPAVLIECGFLSNEEECRMLSDENYRQKLATVLFEAIKDYSKNNGL